MLKILYIIEKERNIELTNIFRIISHNIIVVKLFGSLKASLYALANLRYISQYIMRIHQKHGNNDIHLRGQFVDLTFFDCAEEVGLNFEFIQDLSPQMIGLLIVNPFFFH
jgi:hypothetical protein